MATGANNPGFACAAVPASLRALLSGLIDYAGLFPPAKLSLREAAENFLRYSRGPHAWMLGKFVLPAAQLDAFRDTVAAIPEAAGFAFPLAVLLGGEPARDAELVRKARDEGNASLSIDAIEFRASSLAVVAEICALVPKGCAIFCEVPLKEDLSRWLHVIREARALAKIRTGGVTLESFPSSADVAEFILQCKSQGVGFKATAGLHHPVRSEHALTYESGSVCGVMHGFLNVFLGATLVNQGASKEQFVKILDDARPESFRVAAESFEWNQVRASTADIAATRQNFAISFGSCSFEEPIRDLRKLGLL